MKIRLIIAFGFFLALALPGGRSYAQEIDFDSLLIRRIEVENPTYMPVIGIAAGATPGTHTKGMSAAATSTSPSSH